MSFIPSKYTLLCDLKHCSNLSTCDLKRFEMFFDLIYFYVRCAYKAPVLTEPFILNTCILQSVSCKISRNQTERKPPFANEAFFISRKPMCLQRIKREHQLNY
jgi:hypothetical protein